MAFVTLAPADIAAGQPVDNDLMTQIKDNEDANNAATAGAVNYDIPNGDMELTDGTFPANWAETTYPSGTAGIETTAPINGSQSMKFVHPGGGGNGGGYADSDYLPCGFGAPFRLSWLHSATAATMKNQVIVRYFDEDKVTISSDATVYDSIVNPTTATQFSAMCNPPSTARFYKVRLVGGESSVDVAGTAVFDAVTVERSRVRTFTVSGSVATIEMLDIRDSKKLELSFNNVTHGAIGFGVQVSADNGATWVTSNSYYSAADDATGTTGVTSFLLGLAAGTTPITGEVVIQNLGVADYTRFKVDQSRRDATPGVTNYKKSGILNTTASYNAIRIIPSTTTIDSGTFILEELL